VNKTGPGYVVNGSLKDSKPLIIYPIFKICIWFSL